MDRNHCLVSSLNDNSDNDDDGYDCYYPTNDKHRKNPPCSSSEDNSLVQITLRELVAG